MLTHILLEKTIPSSENGGGFYLRASVGAKVVIEFLMNIEESHGFRIVVIQRDRYITGTTTFSA